MTSDAITKQESPEASQPSEPSLAKPAMQSPRMFVQIDPELHASLCIRIREFVRLLNQ